jgi:hypothetical protein
LAPVLDWEIAMKRAEPQHRAVRTAPPVRRSAEDGRDRDSGLPDTFHVRALDHPTATVLRQATVVQWQRSSGNARIARAIAQRQNDDEAMPAGAVQRTVIQRAMTFDVAKQRIKRASAGWGTDEDAIYDAIRECNDRPRLETDPEVQRLLKSEMKDHELWKAQLLLRFGNEAAFPPAIKEIYASTDRGGVDKKRFFKAIQSLSAADAQLIAAVPGLDEVLKKHLLKPDLAAAKDVLTGGYATAIVRHKANVAHMKTELTRWKSPASPQKLRNTGEWLEPSTPGVAAKNDLFVLTPTHDSAARATKQDHKNEVAYFGDTTQYPSDAADYDPQIKSERNIHYAAPSVQGEHLGRRIWVHDPLSVPAARLEQVLVHEVQHDADRHDKEQGASESFKSPLESWNRYKTEFRAYWVDGQRDLLSTATNPALAPFDNAKQRDIFVHMYGISATDVYAVWLRPNYDNNTSVYGQKFQDLVHAYKGPEGVNLVNSPRIDDFYAKLDRCGPRDSNMAASPLKELEAAANVLTADDRTAVNAANAGRLQEMMKDHLGPTALAHIATIVNGGAAPAWLGVNIAQARKTIVAAGAGWGSDEKMMYKTIEKASPAERAQMKTDPTIRRILYSELKGHDLWQALFMLEWGVKSNWPAEVVALWNATKGAGTDEEAIRKTLRNLPRAQVEALGKIEGIRDMLRADLSGDDEKAAEDVLSGYSGALTDHQQDMAAVSAMIHAGLTDPDPAWQAICVKLNDPTKAMLHAMTRTHDAWQRAVSAGKMGSEAYFGADAPYPSTTGRYDSGKTKNQGIRFVAPGTPSQTSGTRFYVYNARSIPAANLKTLLQTFGGTLH